MHGTPKVSGTRHVYLENGTMLDELIAKKVVDAAFQVHMRLGPGLLESTYEHCLAKELTKRELNFERQKGLPVYYDDEKLDLGYRTDLIVEGRIIIEIKAGEEFHDVHIAQILTYLRLSDLRLGFLINFHTTKFKHGIRRVINGYDFT